MSPLKVTVTGVRQVVLGFEGKNAAVRTAVWSAIERLGLRLEGDVKGVWLSGRALHRRTGRLASSVHARFKATDKQATSTVGTNVPYGRFWELGFHGTEQVRAHTRRVESRSHRGWVLVSYTEAKRRKIAQGIALVRSFTRRVDQNARPFLAPALAGMEAQIRQEIQLAVERGLADGR